MRPIATDGIAWSIMSVYAYLLVTFINHAKRLNRSRCGLRADLRVPKEPCIRWGRNPPWEGTIFGVVWPSVKHCQSLLRCMLQKKLNIGITASLLPRTAMLVGVTLHCPNREQSAPCDAAFCQNSLTTCFTY